ncbi:MAG: hydroxymethylbilane synthase, partial [Saprospiraceae bacterium]|nr:hydroxymethylbilane synthase [Saprospiraceae bacterium]
MTLKIGTRGSKLALWQAAFTQKELARIGVESELVVIKTKGDQVQHLGFDKMEGKGFFTKEIEDALLRGE